MGRSQTIYDGLNGPVLSLVPESAVRILDVGCGTGTLGEHLLQNGQRYVVGITYSSAEAEVASTRLSDVYCADLTDFDFSPLGKFDCVILSHILEHMYFPTELLERLKSVLTPESVIVVALPNVVWWKQRLQFLAGRWRYQDWGILDRTHFRFFDQRSSAELLEDAGFEILQRTCDGPFPFIKPIRGLIGPLAGKIDRHANEWMPGLFAFQFIYLARIRDRPFSTVLAARPPPLSQHSAKGSNLRHPRSRRTRFNSCSRVAFSGTCFIRL
jgi:SAM-dependent methyltransferase